MVVGGFGIKVCLITHTMTPSHRMSINPKIKTSYPGQARSLLFSGRFQISFSVISIFGFACPPSTRGDFGFRICFGFRVANFEF